MFAIGVLVFGLTLGNSPVGLVLISLATSAAATGLGLMVTSLGKTLEQVSGLSTLLSIILSVVGGMMVPISVMPEFLQKMALFTPHSWALRGYQDIIVRGLGVGEILPAVGTLMLFALGFWGIALWRFRYDQAG
jgi:ABC-2 type transport system permease protein